MTRRQRRAAQSTQEDGDIKFAQPDRSGPKGKSLMDVAAEKQEKLQKDLQDRENYVPWLSGTPGEQDDEAPLLNAVLYSLTLTIIHFTLDLLVYHQYAQEVNWDEIISHIWTVLPSFAVIVYITKLPHLTKFPLLRQLLFFSSACTAGCYLVQVGNKHPYMAVMKRAPPLGALLMWSFVEMNVLFAFPSLVVIATFTWLKGFSVF